MFYNGIDLLAGLIYSKGDGGQSAMMENSFIERYEHIPVAYYGTDQTAAEQEISIAPVHNHREFEIVLIRHGACEFTLNCRDFRAQEGDLILLNPYVIHSIRLPPGDSVGHDCICLDLSILDDPAMQGAIENGKLSVAGPFEKTRSIQSCGVSLQSSWTTLKTGPLLALSCQGAISILFAELLSCGCGICLSRKPTKPVLPGDSGVSERAVSQRYLFLYGGRAFFLQSKLFLPHLQSLFGRSFSEYLNIFRLSMSKSLLLDTSLSITDIAAACGFKNPSYFAQVYKKSSASFPAISGKKTGVRGRKKQDIKTSPCLAGGCFGSVNGKGLRRPQIPRAFPGFRKPAASRALRTPTQKGRSRGVGTSALP